ncbi:MAG: VIT family protein [Actinomycetaceae bacterium]|nr:VIT family protein [Actinomycetaceae bacterium]
MNTTYTNHKETSVHLHEPANEETLFAPSALKENTHEIGSLSEKLNWLRAAVLGANDGILSTAGLVTGITGAALDHKAILTSGIAGLLAGAFSMAAGEYVSVSTQKDAELAQIEQLARDLENNTQEETAKLSHVFVHEGGTQSNALHLAKDLTHAYPVRTHALFRFGIALDSLTSPINAAIASAPSFIAGGIIPLLAIIFSPTSIILYTTMASVLLALALTGFLAATMSKAGIWKVMVRNIVGGTIVMLGTYAIGTLISLIL